MFNPFTSFGGKSCLGVDIGTTAIKIVEVGGSRAEPKLLNYGVLETHGYLTRQNAAIQTGGLKAIEDEAAALLGRLIKESGFRTRDAVAALPSFSAFITVFEIPEMPDADILKTLQFQIPQYIPIPPEEAVIDWLPVGERKDDQGLVKKQILLITVPKDAIERYKSIFRLAGLRLRVLEVESLSVIRALARGDETPVIIVDIGSRSTNIAVTHKGFLLQNSQTDFAGASLTQAIANGLGITMKRAEELKRERGIRFTQENSELSTLTLPFLDAILNEVKRVRATFEKNAGVKIERIILAGGSANTVGLPDYFAKHLEIGADIANPFLVVRHDPALVPIAREIGPMLAVALGLGMREFS
ncbi:type IV pilus assembly protein PilM [Candidatus Wolfebacteria bacterium]|nr:type IV pilus assembly protein PilM [Candidatus Wolfebacteria bacterium]